MIPAIFSVDIVQLASGDRLAIQVYRFQGDRPGKKAYLQANLHGAEISGNAVLHELIQRLLVMDSRNLTGELWLVPTCNPLSASLRSHHFSSGRYNPYDGKDWNRIFWDYEKEGEDILTFARSHQQDSPDTIRQRYLARIQASFQTQLEKLNAPPSVSLSDRYRTCLQGLCLDANYVIDLHSSTNQAVDYLYGFATREPSADLFLLEHGILLDEYDGDAFDEAFIKPWLALERCFAQLGREVRFEVESWTLELGWGMKVKPDSVAAGVKGILNYLTAKEMLTLPGFPLPEGDRPRTNIIKKSDIVRYHAPAGGVVQQRASLGSRVTKGDRLYQVLSFNREGKLPEVKDVPAEADGLVFDVSTNESVNQGDYVLSLIP